MREICSYGSVGERGGNEPLYPEKSKYKFLYIRGSIDHCVVHSGDCHGALRLAMTIGDVMSYPVMLNISFIMPRNDDLGGEGKLFR